MQEEDLSSKVTTLTMIDRLLEAKILIDASTRRYQSTLKINPGFDFYKLLIEAIYFKTNDVAETLKRMGLIKKNEEFNVVTKIDKKRGKVEATVAPTPTAT